MTTGTFEAKTPPAGDTPKVDAPTAAGKTPGSMPHDNSTAVKLARRHARIALMEAEL
jgi:hypothetical protein